MRAPTKTFARARRFRREMSLPEVVLWQRVRRGGLNGLPFRRQHAVGPYVLDFYCAEARLAVEVDGSAHDHPDRVAHDARRLVWLSEQGIAVLRQPAADVLRGEEAEHVLPTIAAACAGRIAAARPLHHASRGPPPPFHGGGTPESA